MECRIVKIDGNFIIKLLSKELNNDVYIDQEFKLLFWVIWRVYNNVMLKDKILKVNQWLVRCTSEHLNSYLMSSGWKEIWYALGNHVLVYLHFTSFSLSQSKALGLVC